MRFQRRLQIPFLLLFLALLWLASFPLPSWIDVRMFLKLDPLISLGTMAAARAFIPGLVWAVLVLGLALILGRVFCGYFCPLGTTIDLSEWMGRSGKRPKGEPFEGSGRWRDLKYLLLLGLAVSALIGLGFHFLFSPLSIITRFYGLVVYPVLTLFAAALVAIFRPVLTFLGSDALSFVQVQVPHFSTNWFVAAMAVGILLLGFIQPRFWCRNVCPAGAILALCSRRPFFRRSVSEQCTACGRCLRACPVSAISRDFVHTAHSECIVCLRCREVCPEGAISFKRTRADDGPIRAVDVSRRKFIAAGVTGAAVSAVAVTNLRHLHDGQNPRAIRASTLIRPPGALPEPMFQDRCVRCGECVKGCLTNTLQLAWFEAGISGLWTPVLTSRLAGCEQNCNLCGHVCPTGAIRPLTLEEKPYAKIGTARIISSRCIAWEQNKRCLVCDEICPYNAISSRFVAGHTVTVPVVDENKCNGCGYCENKCPVEGESAVVVEPIGELRLAAGSYREKARELGLVFHAKDSVADHFILDGAAQEEGRAVEPDKHGGPEEGSLPPGFTVDQ
jgi:MauM/NapG family ferredoxin protein